MLGQAREDEERGAGIPFTVDERVRRHYAQYGTTELPPRGTGLGGFELQSIGVLKGMTSIGQSEGNVLVSDILGLVGGGALGFYIAKRWPHSIVKWIGVIVGAELGIVLVRIINSAMIARSIGAK